MSLTALEAKLKTVPETCFEELYDFMEFLEYKTLRQKNGLDEAIAEFKRGEYKTYNSFDDFKVAMAD